MAKFNDHQVKEINEVIASITTTLEKIKSKKCEIGARDKATLKAILHASKVEPVSLTFFKCKREYSDTIITHFMNEKKLPKSRFSATAQESIFIILSK